MTRLWPFILIGLGFFLRIVQYLHNRALRLDEVLLANFMEDHTLSELLSDVSPELVSPIAPFGFLWVQKNLMSFFGSDEYVLRFFPLICGLLSLVIFYQLARQLFDRFGQIVSLSFFCFSGTLIFYSSDCKPYAFDVLIAVVLLKFAYLLGTKISGKQMIYLAIVGVLAPWFSFPSVFILGALMILLTLRMIQNETSRKLIALIVLWSLNLFLVYWLRCRGNIFDQHFQNFWAPFFFPWDSDISFQFRWVIERILDFFHLTMGLKLGGLALFASIVGAVFLRKKNQSLFYISLVPWILALGFSCVSLYPFHGRLLLFAIPGFILLITCAIERLRCVLESPHRWVVTLLWVLLIFYPFAQSLKGLVGSRSTEDVKVLFNQIEEGKREGDSFYFAYGLQDYLKYYKKNLERERHQIRFSPSSPLSWSEHQKALESVDQSLRLWILLRPRVITRFYENYLNQKYSLIKKTESGGLILYLYEVEKIQ